MANVPQQEAMEDILSSIRTTMAEETAKVGNGSADLIEAAAQADGDEDVLELTPAEMVPEAAGPEADEEALIDLEAFASSGESKPAAPASDSEAHDELTALPQEKVAAVPEVTAEAADSAEEAADEFDRLLAEISQEQENQVAAVEEHKQALLAEEEPLGVEASPQLEAVAEVAEKIVTEQLKQPAMPPVAASATTYAAQAVGNGGQIAFPAEVLAMALRPMVQEWLTENLPAVVERLVKAEIDKLSQN